MKDVFQPDEHRTQSEQLQNETKVKSKKEKDNEQESSQTAGAESNQLLNGFSKSDYIEAEKQKQILEKSMKEYHEFMNSKGGTKDDGKQITLNTIETALQSPQIAQTKPSIAKLNPSITKKKTPSRNTSNKQRNKNSKGNNIINFKDEEKLPAKELLNIHDQSNNNFQQRQVEDAPNSILNSTLQEETTSQRQQIPLNLELTDIVINQINEENKSQNQQRTLENQEIGLEGEQHNAQQSSPSKQSSSNSDSEQDKKGKKIESSSKQIDKIKWIIAQNLLQNKDKEENNKLISKKLELSSESHMNLEKKQQKRQIQNKKKQLVEEEEEKEEIFLESAEEESNNNDGGDNEKNKMKKIHLERCNNLESSDNLEQKNLEKQRNSNDNNSNNLENEQKQDKDDNRDNKIEVELKGEKNSAKTRKRRKPSVKKQQTLEKKQRRKPSSKGKQKENEEESKNAGIVVPAISLGISRKKTEKGLNSGKQEDEVENDKSNNEDNAKKEQQQELSQNLNQFGEDSKDLDDLLDWEGSYEEDQGHMRSEKKETWKRKRSWEKKDQVEDDSDLNSLLMSDCSQSRHNYIDEEKEKRRYNKCSQQSQQSDLISSFEDRMHGGKGLNKRSQKKIGIEEDLMDDEDDDAILDELLADSPVNNRRSQEENKNNNSQRFREKNGTMRLQDQGKYQHKKEKENKLNQNRDRFQQQWQEEEDDDDEYLQLLDDDRSEEGEGNGCRINEKQEIKQQWQEGQSQGEKIYMSDESSGDRNKDKKYVENMEVKSNNGGYLDEDNDFMSLLDDVDDGGDGDDDNGRIQDQQVNENENQNQGSVEKQEQDIGMDLEGKTSFDDKNRNDLQKFSQNSKQQDDASKPNNNNNNLNYEKGNENYKNSGQTQSQMSQGLLNSNELLDGSDFNSQFSRNNSQQQYQQYTNNYKNNSCNESNSSQNNNTNTRRKHKKIQQFDKYQHEDEEEDREISDDFQNQRSSRDPQIRTFMNNQQNQQPRRFFLFEILENNKLLELEQRDKERRERLRQQQAQLEEKSKEKNNRNLPRSRCSSISRSERSQSYQDEDLFMSQFSPLNKQYSQDQPKIQQMLKSQSNESLSNRLLQSQISRESKKNEQSYQSLFSQELINSQQSQIKGNGQNQSYSQNKAKSIFSSEKLLDSQSQNVLNQTNNRFRDNIDYLEVVRNQFDSKNSQKQSLLSGMSQEIAGVQNDQGHQRQDHYHSNVDEGTDRYLDYLNSQMNEENDEDLLLTQKKHDIFQKYDNQDDRYGKEENDLLSFGCQSQNNSDNRDKNEYSRRNDRYDSRKYQDSTDFKFRNRNQFNSKISQSYQSSRARQFRQDKEKYYPKQSLFKQSHKRKWKDCNFEDYSDENNSDGDFDAKNRKQQQNYWWQPQKRIEYWSQEQEIQKERQMNIEEEEMQRKKRMKALKHYWEMKANKRQQKALEKQQIRRYNNDDRQYYDQNGIQTADKYLQYSRDRKRGRPRKYPIGVTGQRLMRIQKYKGKAIADNLRQTLISKKLTQEEANNLLEHHETGCIRRSNRGYHRGRYGRRDNHGMFYGEQGSIRRLESRDKYRQTMLNFRPQQNYYVNSDCSSNSSSYEYMKLLQDTPSATSESISDGLQNGSFMLSSEREESFDFQMKKGAKKQQNSRDLRYMAVDEQYNVFDNVNYMQKLSAFLEIKTENYLEFFLSDDSKLRNHWILGCKDSEHFYKKRYWRKSRRQELQDMNRELSQKIIQKYKQNMLQFESAQSYCLENNITALKGIKSRRKNLIDNSSSKGTCNGQKLSNLLHRIPSEHENTGELSQVNGQESLETQKLDGQVDDNTNDFKPVEAVYADDQSSNHLGDCLSDKEIISPHSSDDDDDDVHQKLEKENNITEKLHQKENIYLEMPSFYKLICSYKPKLFGQ